MNQLMLACADYLINEPELAESVLSYLKLPSPRSHQKLQTPLSAIALRLKHSLLLKHLEIISDFFVVVRLLPGITRPIYKTIELQQS